MLRLSPSPKVYLAAGATDLRNNIDGLLILIEKQLKLNPFDSCLFVFCNRKRDKLKILFWDNNGFWLYYRRLESGHAVYDSIAADDKKNGARAMDVKAVACLVHVRRKFADALKLLKPLLEDFFAWVKTEYDISLHETHYGRALEYAIKEEKKVMRVLEDGRLELDNNLAERTVKLFVIGRKNWLFADTPQGAEASCIIYSIVQTAIMNHLIPFEYIKYLLEQMPGKALTDKFIETLLPWSGQLPEYVKAPSENTDI